MAERVRFELTQALKAPNALAVRPLDQLEYLSKSAHFIFRKVGRPFIYN